MTNTTPIFSGFHIQTLRRTRRSSQQVLADQRERIRLKSLSQMEACFGRYLPLGKLHPKPDGHHSRRRIYSLSNTFWAFFSQILSPEGGCRESVARLQAHAAENALPVPSASTAAYCRARKKIPEEDLVSVFEHTAESMKDDSGIDCVGGRRVVVVDGTGLSMPDTEKNQTQWPQKAAQKPGCGFPTMTLSACFSLKNSALLSYETGSKHDSEQALFRKQWDVFEEGDIFLGDKQYCSYFDLAMLKQRDIDSVVGLASNRRKPVKTKQAIRKLSPGDLLVEWSKPSRWNSKAAYSREEWEQLPETLVLRQIKMNITGLNGRKKSFYVVTTLLDPTVYSSEQLLQLYYHRWQVELFFRDIKTSMGMEILRCKTPELIRKEILMHFITYNCIRRLIFDASVEFSAELGHISFKAALQTIRHWVPYFEGTSRSSRKRRELLGLLRQTIAYSKVFHRPGRHEPRCIKRRLSSYQKLNAPRYEMIPTEVKGRYHYKEA